MTAPTERSAALAMREAAARVAMAEGHAHRLRDDPQRMDAAFWIATKIEALPVPADPEREALLAVAEAALAHRKAWWEEDGTKESEELQHWTGKRVDAALARLAEARKETGSGSL